MLRGECGVRTDRAGVHCDVQPATCTTAAPLPLRPIFRSKAEKHDSEGVQKVALCACTADQLSRPLEGFYSRSQLVRDLCDRVSARHQQQNSLFARFRRECSLVRAIQRGSVVQP